MSKLLNRSLKKLITYAALVLVCSIPVYYAILSRLWQYELREHHIILTDKADREDTYLIIAAVTSLTVLFFGLLLVGFIMLNRRISKRLWKPFYKSLAQIKSFDINRQESMVFEHTDIDEFSELNTSLEKLIAGNITAYKQQKEFADNASHELQTPLAIIQSKLELLMQSRSLTTEQYSEIEETLIALSRVTRINKNLLLLTKIENSQFWDTLNIDLSAMLNEAVGKFEPFAQSKKLTINAAIAPGIIVEGNNVLMEIVLNNLITNAMRYCSPNGTITIDLSAHSLMITNSGSTPLKPEQLFKRFSTASPGASGTGLGLALVRQISQRYGWNAHYRFEDGLHVFMVDFNPSAI